MKGSFRDLSGQTFNRWTVIQFVKINKHGRARWLCRCSCEKQTIREISSNHLVCGTSKSCGCFMVERVKKANTKYGCSTHPLRNIWMAMVDRCTNPRNGSFHNYGGRKPNPVTICQEWYNDHTIDRGFLTYKHDIESLGWTEGCGLEIDRKDNRLGYNIQNCRLTTSKINNNNRRNNRKITFDGQEHTISEWSDITGLSYGTIWARLRRGWTLEQTLTTK